QLKSAFEGKFVFPPAYEVDPTEKDRRVVFTQLLTPDKLDEINVLAACPAIFQDTWRSKSNSASPLSVRKCSPPPFTRKNIRKRVSTFAAGRCCRRRKTSNTRRSICRQPFAPAC